MKAFTYPAGQSDGQIVFFFTTFFLVVAGISIFFALARYWYKKDRQAGKFLDNQTIPSVVANLTGLDFEAWTAGLLESLGLKSKVVGGNNDGGVDVVAEWAGKKIAVQCKKYYGGKLVGEKAVRELYGAMAGGGYSYAVLFTTSNFTLQARSWAKGKPGLVLVNAKFLERIIRNGKILLDLLT